MSKKPPAISLAIQAVGSAKALAEQLGISLQAVSQWKCIPSGRVLAVERVTGVPRHVLRPDIYPAQRERFVELGQSDIHKVQPQ
ncbi:DNA-binding transcriptional regulator YdaS, prophage-encoded, Cro superfamily [Kaistia soli DSM 19436]|uniref:DNA-binding transcriptional regulator YdaS, prophage-encoded, Cro superfamily n=1 Tax=Kaistia soli DSM 19436 TaxID=1122133 RepID=A0A1M4YFS6_9HYPH|nr:Cro/CI family transcriptional regulator [Kaistia soli]SHF04513.1 DNA-binding transcriptional regulator YdaS, prophage-encoded, Cro superfamily [Kaistia soli DSM 19436]